MGGSCLRLTINEFCDVVDRLVDDDVHAIVRAVFLRDFVFGDCFRHFLERGGIVYGNVDANGCYL